jgi:hypothetical protein
MPSRYIHTLTAGQDLGILIENFNGGMRQIGDDTGREG